AAGGCRPDHGRRRNPGEDRGILGGLRRGRDPLQPGRLGVIATVLPISMPVFLAGAGLMALAARKIPLEQRRRLWLKFLVYVLVVHLVLATIVADWFVVVLAPILVAGAVEL